MYCNNCKREVDDTLELYNGKFACAQCKKTFDIDNLAITDANNEQFALSEILFHTALKQQGGKSKYRAQLDKAVAMCKQAAFSGHPKAVIRLAYYYEMGYCKVDEVTAFKMACQYYQKVWQNSFADSSLISSRQLRQVAAKRHLALLEHVPASLQAYADIYDFKKVCSRMAVHGIEVNPKQNAGLSSTDVDEGARITAILDSCLGGTRVPLFGLMAVRGSTLVCWANSDVKIGKKTEKRLDCYTDIRNLELHLLWTKGQNVRRLVNLSSLSGGGVGNRIEEDGMYYLCFINGREKRFGRSIKFLTPKESSDDSLFRIVNKASLISAQKDKFADFVFYTDDVLMYRESRMESVKHAVHDLVDAVCKSMD